MIFKFSYGVEKTLGVQKHVHKFCVNTIRERSQSIGFRKDAVSGSKGDDVSKVWTKLHTLKSEFKNQWLPHYEVRSAGLMRWTTLMLTELALP